MQHHPGFRVDGGDRRGDRVQLARADVGDAVHDLAVQVRQFDDIRVDNADRSNARGGKVGDGCAAEPTGADDEHASGREPPLGQLIEAGQRQLATVAREPLWAQRWPRVNQGAL